MEDTILITSLSSAVTLNMIRRKTHRLTSSYDLSAKYYVETGGTKKSNETLDDRIIAVCMLIG